MRYLDSMERSAKHLRAALPLMTRQHAALHPVSYAVWYEYVSGSNPDLARELEPFVRNQAALDEAQTLALFRRHIVDTQAHDASAQRVSDGFVRVLDEMAAASAQAGDQTARLDNSLSGWVEQLLDDSLAHRQSHVLQEVLEGTRELRQVMQTLQQRLDYSQSEIAELREEVQRARNEALVDALTGLANRRAFEQRLHDCLRETSDSSRQAPCLVLSDIDFFKRLNDSYGHQFGDHVLRAVARQHQGLTSECAVAARVGGEEFALLLPSAALPEAQRLAEQLRQDVASSRIRRGEVPQDIERVTISLGVTQLAVGESANAFFARADKALYASKHSGRNCVTVLRAA
jgi:diguanylate cyclase